MVSSGTVNGDLSTLKSHGSSYTSTMEGLSGSWKGASHDSIQAKAEEFISEFIGAIEGEMSSFASACDLYEKYKTLKDSIPTLESNYNTAVSNKDINSANSYAAQINSARTEMASLKSQIEAALAAASAQKLTATATSATVSTTAGDDSNSKTESTDSTQTTVATNGANKLNGNVIDTSTPVGTGTKYNLSDDELAYLAYVAKREQGTVGGSKLELSLMVNLYEKNKSKYSSVTDYVKNSGWFASNSRNGYSYPGDEYVAAAKEVVANGTRYLPSNVVEHDCISDISSISTGSRSDRSNYVPGQTVIKNRYGATYVFVGFAPDGGDPFGYLV